MNTNNYDKEINALLWVGPELAAKTYMDFVNIKTAYMSELCSKLLLNTEASEKFTRICFVWIEALNRNYLKQSNNSAIINSYKYGHSVFTAIEDILEPKFNHFNIKSIRFSPDEDVFTEAFLRAPEIIQQLFTKLVACWLETIGNKDHESIAGQMIAKTDTCDRQFPAAS